MDLESMIEEFGGRERIKAMEINTIADINVEQFLGHYIMQRYTGETDDTYPLHADGSSAMYLSMHVPPHILVMITLTLASKLYEHMSPEELKAWSDGHNCNNTDEGE